jgi:signal transduction histidine kinase
MRFIYTLILFYCTFPLMYAQDISDLEKKAIYFASKDKLDSCAILYAMAANTMLNKQNTIEYCRLKCKEGEIYYNNVDAEKSIPLHQELYDKYAAFLKEKNPLIIYQICSRLGADYNYSNKMDLALQYLNEAELINENSNLKQRGVYLNLFQYFKDEDKLIQAFTYINKYKVLSVELNDSTGIGNAYYCIGMLYFHLLDYKKAAENYNTSLEFFQRCQKFNECYKPLMGIGNCNYALKRYKDALSSYKKCQVFCKSSESAGVCMVNIINSFVDLYQLDSAKIYIEKFEKIRYKYKNLDVEYDYFNALAGYYENKGDFKRAILILQKNKELYTRKNAKPILISINERLAALYAKSGQTQLAYQLLEKAYLLKDTLNRAKLAVLDSLSYNYAKEQSLVLLQKQENKILEQNILIQKRTNWGLLALSAFLIIGMIGIYWSNQLRLKKVKAEEEATQKTEDFKTFRYSVSHDLKNPVMVAKQKLEELSAALELKKESQMVDSIGVVQQSLNSINHLVNRLKDFATSDNQEIYESEFDCKTLFEDLILQHQSFIKEKNIIIKIGELPRLHTDKVLFFNILDNLFSNALKFSSMAADPTIDISFEKRMTLSSLRISDNGVGVQPEMLETIFEPFVRQHAEYEGTGLGLAIVKRLATLLKMSVKIQNNSSAGVTATLLILPKNII